MKKRYFGTDGIRGTSNVAPMTADLAMRVGAAVGRQFRNGDHRHRVVIGKDTRLSGYMLENALVAGFTAAGLDVFLLGPIPTPGVAMLTRSLRADIGVMISASHNPYQDNGIKLFGPDGYKLSDDLEAKIEALIDSDFETLLVGSDDIGRAKRVDGDIYRYIEFVKRTLPRGSRDFSGLRIVVDCANGAAYKVAPTVLWEMGAEVIRLGDKPNGTNINLNCGSTHPDALIAKVREVRADIGIALDGDADRLLIVDENGAVVDGDQIMTLIGEKWADEQRLKGGGIVATVMSNLGMERYLESKKMTLARTKVGDRYVVEHMRKHGYNLGGEQSGHIVMSDYATTGDGLVAALQILSCAQKMQRPISEITKRFEPVPQLLKNTRFSGTSPLEDNAVLSAIADAEAQLGNSGRLVIRASGTEPLIRVMAEGDDVVQIEGLVDGLIEVIKAA